MTEESRRAEQSQQQPTFPDLHVAWRQLNSGYIEAMSVTQGPHGPIYAAGCFQNNVIVGLPR